MCMAEALLRIPDPEKAEEISLLRRLVSSHDRGGLGVLVRDQSQGERRNASPNWLV